MMKICYIYTMEFYSSINKIRILRFIGEWLDLGNTNVAISVYIYIDEKTRKGSMIGRKKEDFSEKGGKGHRIHII